MRLNIVWMRIGLSLGLVGGLVTGHLATVSAQSDPAGFDTVINAPPTVIDRNEAIGSNTQLNLTDGGSIGSFVDAGVISETATNIEVNISGGEVGSGFTAFSGSVVNISDGLVGSSSARRGSIFNISGGVLGSLTAFSGSTINISGGDMGRGAFFSANSGSTVFINGGRLGSRFFFSNNSDVTLVGGEFLINGVAPLDPASVTLSETDVLSGTLEDGEKFIFSPAVADSINGVRLLPGTLPAIDLTPVLIADADDAAPNNLRAGQSLTLRGTGVLPDGFVAVDADLTIEGGTVGSGWEIANSTIDVTAGEIQNGSLFGSTLNLEDGVIGGLNAFSGTTVNQSGGTLSFIRLGEESVLNLTGGTFGNGLAFLEGTVGVTSITAESGSTLNLFVSEASISGVALDLVAGETFVVEQRSNAIMSGELADGSEFAFLLSSFPLFALGGDSFAAGSTVTVTLVPAAPEIILGDVNQDDVVNFFDVGPFIDVLLNDGFVEQADINQDGEVNFLDVDPFVEILADQ